MSIFGSLVYIYIYIYLCDVIHLHDVRVCSILQYFISINYYFHLKDESQLPYDNKTFVFDRYYIKTQVLQRRSLAVFTQDKDYSIFYSTYRLLDVYEYVPN